MTDREQIDHFAHELDKLIDRFRLEYHIPYAAVVGTLQIKIHALCDEGLRDENKEA